MGEANRTVVATFDASKSSQRSAPGPWHALTWEQFEATADYLRSVADDMRLTDWTFKLRHTPVEGRQEVFAEVDPTFGRKLATVTVCWDWADQLPGDRRHVIVHELVHCHLDGMHSLIHSDEFETILGRPAHALFGAAFRQQLEFATDAVADVIERQIPLLYLPGDADYVKPQAAEPEKPIDTVR